MRRFAIGFAVLCFACGGSDGGSDDPGVTDPGIEVEPDATDVPGGADAVDVAYPDGTPEGATDVPDAPGDAAEGTGDADEGAEVSPDGVVDTLPDASFFFANRTPAESAMDAPFKEDYVTRYRTTDQLPDLNVTAMAWIMDTLWVSTPTGLFTYDAGSDRFVAGPFDAPGAIALAAGHGATQDLVVAGLPAAVRVWPLSGGATEYAVPGQVTSVATNGDEVYAGTTSGLFKLEGTAMSPQNGTTGVQIRGLAFAGPTRLYLATASGLRTSDGALSLLASAGLLPDDDVRAVASGKNGTLVAACATGIAVITDGVKPTATVVTAGKGGLPTDNLTSIAASSDTVLIGHAIGSTATSVDPVKAWDHYANPAWLPDNHVTAVALGTDGSRWIGTPQGVSRIRWRADRTLADKEASMFDVMDQHMWRMDGFISSGAYTDDAWQPTVWANGDEDNDGLWTQMAIGAMCYAYSITKDEKYYAVAHKAMQNMFLQIDVPAVDFVKAGLGRGFVTRSLVRDDEGTLFTSKATQSNWHLVHYTNGHDYYWKGDTSSDETTGHFFGYPLYYDLCAKDDAERAAVADHAGALARYIIAGGYRLLDVDGQPTGYGHFEPAFVAAAVDGLEACGAAGTDLSTCFGAAFGGGWLNSLEIMGHLLSAWHMTGDPAIYAAYDELITKYRYNEVAAFSDNVYTVTHHDIANHSDHELAMLAYHTLIRYEPNDGRRKQWTDSLAGMYGWEAGDAQGSGNERQPLWTALMSLADPAKAHVADGVRTLREYPFDLRVWGFDNTHRKDAANWVNDRFGDPQFDTVFPYDELNPWWWNSNPYAKKDGGSGRSIQGPTAFLLAYWAQRYAGVLK